MTFGDFVKGKRTQAGLSLREFCRLTGLDPSNWSRVERDLFSPPKSQQTIRDIASALLIAEESADWIALYDLAAIGQIPLEIREKSSVWEAMDASIQCRLTYTGKPSPSFFKDVLKIFQERKQEEKKEKKK